MLTTNVDEHVYEAAAALQDLNDQYLKVTPKVSELVRVASIVINSHGAPGDFDVAVAQLNAGLVALEQAINRVHQAIQPK